MSTFEEHEAEQAAMTARYEALCAAGKKLHDDYGYHVDDLAGEDASNEAHELLIHEMGFPKYDEWRADLREVQVNDLERLRPVHGGGDPEDMNAERIAWGQSLAQHCHKLTGTDMEDAVSDAIAYLLHAAPTWGETAERVVERAVAHFNEETETPKE